jgi:hypothetical protein
MGLTFSRVWERMVSYCIENGFWFQSMMVEGCNAIRRFSNPRGHVEFYENASSVSTWKGHSGWLMVLFVLIS